MENESSSPPTICNMNKEFLIETIMSCLDGPTLAATACASSDLRSAASDQNLWKNLCTATWPSLTNSTASETLKSRDFSKLYADAFPLILCQPQPNSTPKPPPAHATSSELASFVDIYYKGKCIISKAIDTIPESIDASDNEVAKSDELKQWLLDYPFRLDLLPPYDDTDIIPEYDNIKSPQDNNDSITYIEKANKGLDLRDELAEDIRLSWIVFDKKNGTAVNLSSWKPMFVQKSWAPDGEYVLHFGSNVPVDDKFAECKIVARCHINNDGYAKWTEISMRVENMVGVHLNTSKSLGVFNRALVCKRTARHVEVERANREYKMYKKEMKRRNDRRDYLVDKLYALVGLTVLTTISYGCATLII